MGILLEISAFIGVCTVVFLVIGLVNSIGRNDVVEKPVDKEEADKKIRP